MDSKELKRSRGLLGLTQRELAELINTKISTLQKWESGVNPVSGAAETAVKLLLGKK